MATNPLLAEIQTKGPTSPMLSPAAQNAARMAGFSPDPTMTAAPVLHPGTLLPQNPGPEPTNLITMPGQTPSLSMPSKPALVSGPNKGQAILSNGAQPSPSQAHMEERNRLISEGPGEDQLYGKITGSHFGQAHPLLGKLLGGLAEGGAKLADVGVSAVAPQLTMAMPGTAYHHDLLLNQANRTVGQDEANAQKEAQTAAENATAEHTAAETPEVAPNAESARALRGAQTREGNDRAQAMENPAPKFSIHDTESGPLFVNEGTGEAQHLSIDGQPVGPKVKLTQSQPIVGEDGKPHTYMLDEKGNKVADLGVHYERPMSINIGAQEANDPELIQQIGTGKMPVGRMSYLLARNPQLLSQVSRAFPDFDASKVESYANTYKDFTSGRTSVMLNSGATALGHLNELKKLNTDASHVPGTPAYNAYENKADTVAVELARFYGDPTVPAIQAIKKTLTATLPGQRDAAITTQAQSMGDKLAAFEQQWKNAAPSKEYQAPMPGISDSARNSLSEISGPAEGTVKKNASGDTIIYRGGKWQIK